MRSLVAVAITIAAITAEAGGKKDPRTLPGWRIYDRFCLACHGAAGDGKGPAAPFTWGHPRAFSRGVYEWRSTPVGQPPTDEDLRTAIRYGAPGTSMPGFDSILDDAQINQLIDVLKAFDPAAFAKSGKPLVIGPPRVANLERGAHLWTQHGCDKCHGANGRGDGATKQDEAPYDLTALPLRRPRASDDVDTRRRAAVLSIATGLAGTPMPGYAGPVTDADLWALADHVLALGAGARPRTSAALDAESIAADRTAKLATGAWPGKDNEEARVFGVPLRPQGPPLPQLAPAQASLSAKQCARCHAKQAREWQPSLHATASTWGLSAREADHAGDGACARCHTPLAEQQPGPEYDAQLRDEGVTCASCHVRDWVRRGPPRRNAPVPGYPLVELAIYERSDFCMSCHQLPPRTAVNGKPLLNTYKEWLEGPYMARGIQCQNCHMPDREHTWRGIHDRETFVQGIRLDALARRTGDKVSVTATLANIGAGHYLPTTPTPAVWFRIELIDRTGRAIAGARDQLRIGRDVEFTTQWREKSDTRIAPGDRATLARAWKAGRVGEATHARITVEVHPDDFYERLFTARLATKLPAATKRLYETSLARAKAARYVAEQRDVAIGASR